MIKYIKWLIQYVLLYISNKMLIISYNSSAAYVNIVEFGRISSYTIVIGIKQYIKQNFNTVLIPTFKFGLYLYAICMKY